MKYIHITRVYQIFKNREKEDYIKQIITDTKKKIYEKIAEADLKIRWLTENPGTQLTSSFNPIIADEKEWYGDYYKE